MIFEFNRYSGLLLVFFVHGLVYCFLLFQKGARQERRSDKWLALFLLCSILYICPWMLGFAGWYEGETCIECRNFLFYMPLQHTLVMGPAIYFYIRTLLQPSYVFRRSDWWHFLPAALYLIWCGIVVVTDRLVLHRYFLMDGEVDPDFSDWYIAAGLVSMMVYGLASLRFYQKYKRFIVQMFSFADDLTFRWVRNFLIIFSIYFASNFLFHLVQWVGVEVNYIDSWWYYLLFALLFYYVAINGYSNAIESRTRFQLDLLRFQNTQLLSSGSASTPETLTEDVAFEELSAEPARDNADYQEWKTKLESLMSVEKIYTNPDLTLTDLSKRLQINTVQLSRIINQGFGINFNDFVNRYRVEEVKEKLRNRQQDQFTIMSLAYEAGFNSKATFNRAFKKFTGQNPKDFH